MIIQSGQDFKGQGQLSYQGHTMMLQTYTPTNVPNDSNFLHLRFQRFLQPDLPPTQMPWEQKKLHFLANIKARLSPKFIGLFMFVCFN